MLFFRSILQFGQMTYKSSGVDINAGDSLVSSIKSAASATKRNGVIGGIGGFGGLFDLKASGYHDPLLVSGTDGVGTKLKVTMKKIFKIVKIYSDFSLKVKSLTLNYLYLLT